MSGVLLSPAIIGGLSFVVLVRIVLDLLANSGNRQFLLTALLLITIPISYSISVLVYKHKYPDQECEMTTSNFVIIAIVLYLFSLAREMPLIQYAL